MSKESDNIKEYVEIENQIKDNLDNIISGYFKEFLNKFDSKKKI
jgi:hypothetical protein